MRNSTIDYLKVLALAAMIFYHVKFVSFFYDGVAIGTVSDAIGHMARFLFLFLFGLNFKFYEHKANVYFRERFIKLAICAGLISLGTYIWMPEYFVIFGVIHLFCVSLLILKYTSKIFQSLLFVISMASLAVPELLWEHNYLLFMGWHSMDFQSVDYFPIIPYFGVIYLGYLLNKSLLTHLPKLPPNKYLEYISRHTLWIYMLHMPFILLFHYMWK